MSNHNETIQKDEIKNYFVHGAVLIDVDGASLNGWGSDSTNTQGMENTSAVKKVKKNGKWYAVVSGQAWRYWWRETLGYNGWNLSPITRDKKVAFTDANPLKYPDDDIFGYMKAAKEEQEVNGKKKKVDVSVTRISPLKNSILTSVAPTKIENEFSTMARQDGDAVPYEKQFYSTILKGLFSVDLDQAGTFSKVNRSGYKNVTDSLYSEILENSGYEVSDLINPSIKRARLGKNTRISRVKDTILALKSIAGGAHRTTNYVSVKPDFIILAILKGGNNIFDNIAVEEDSRATISTKAIIDTIKDNKEFLRSDVYIGKADGFMDDVILKEIQVDGISIHTGLVNEMIDKFVKEVENIINLMD